MGWPLLRPMVRNSGPLGLLLKHQRRRLRGCFRRSQVGTIPQLGCSNPRRRQLEDQSNFERDLRASSAGQGIEAIYSGKAVSIECVKLLLRAELLDTMSFTPRSEPGEEPDSLRSAFDQEKVVNEHQKQSHRSFPHAQQRRADAMISSAFERELSITYSLNVRCEIAAAN